jgi:predicted transcriptional regulator
MKTLNVRVASRAGVKAGVLKAMKDAQAGKKVGAKPLLTFSSYEDMHRVLAPARLQIVAALAGKGALSIREVARRLGRDVKGVHTDITRLINAGVLDRTEEGVSFPYDQLHMEVDIGAAA